MTKKAKSARAPKTFPIPKRHHLDRRADRIAAEGPGDNDELLTTKQVADWFAVSEEWLEIGRSKGFGPRYKRLGPNLIRYTRGDCRQFLKDRTYASTAEYEAA
jgi:hypothetical protein